MKRRALLAAIAAVLAAAPSLGSTQTARLRRIAFVHPGTQQGYGPLFETFRQALRELGYAEGREISIEIRWADDRTERLPALAEEVVLLNPEVIVTATSAGVAAFKRSTSSIPIVFATAANPVEQGFISSLQRPGGNITGVAVYPDLTQKLVEIAREALPSARRLAVIVHDGDPVHRLVLTQFEPSALRLQFEPMVVRIATAEGLDAAFRRLAEQKPDAVLVPQLALLTSRRADIAQRALKMRLPIISNNPLVAESGGLMSYGTSIEENFRRSAALVDRILRGANPGDLAIDQPERFHLVVNRKTAQTIGVSLSPMTMLRADRIID